MLRSFILYIIVLQFLILSYSDVFASNINMFESPQEMKDSCLKLKQNGFKDQDPISRLTNIYLNSLLDYIVDSNKDLIKEKKLQDRKFCILFNDYRHGQTANAGYGFIFANTSLLILPFTEDDADIAVAISHELAHDILNHIPEIYSLRDEIEKEYWKDNSVERKTRLDFLINYYPKHHLAIEQKRRYEIEADEVGLNIYLNAKFIPTKYSTHFLNTHEIQMKLIFQNKKYKRIFSRLSDEDLSFFKSISTVKGCLSAGIEAIKKNQFDIFMDRIKYIPNFEDNHPTGCFRFWNLEKKLGLQNKENLKNNTISDIISLKLDLNKYSHLNDIKNSFAVNNKEEIVNHYVDILKYIALNNLSSELEYSPYITTEGSNFDEKHNIWNLRFYSLFIKPILKTKYSVNYDSLSI